MLASTGAAGAGVDGAPTRLQAAVDAVCAGALRRNLREANKTLQSAAFPRRAERLAVRRLVKERPLFRDGVEWTPHGTKRTFRFWSAEDKAAYLTRTMELATVLEAMTPHVALGFGVVLGFLRDKDMIRHDDDIDLIVAFDVAEMPTLQLARQKVKDLLTEAGYRCSGDYLSHWNVFFADGQHCDVFVGLIEGPHVSFFPSSRKGLMLGEVFPAQSIDFFGVPCAFPADLEAYVARTYGTSWREPIPFWNLPWNKAEYADIA